MSRTKPTTFIPVIGGSGEAVRYGWHGNGDLCLGSECGFLDADGNHPAAERLTDEERIAGLREVIRAANGDWHEATALYSVQADIQWLLDLALAQVPAQEERATYARHDFRQGGYLTDPTPEDECVWRVDGHSPYCGIARAAHDDVLDRRRGGTWSWAVPAQEWHNDGDACTGLTCGNPEHGWVPAQEERPASCGAILNCALPTNHDGLHERADGIRWSWHENIDHLLRVPAQEERLDVDTLERAYVRVIDRTPWVEVRFSAQGGIEVQRRMLLERIAAEYRALGVETKDEGAAG